MQGIVISDVNALRAACNELISGGLRAELVENQKPRVHGYDSAPTCEFVLKLTGCQYDVGFKRNAKGEYEPVFDVYGNHVGGRLGAEHACEVPNGFEGQALRQLGKFSQTYAKHAAMNQAAAEGYTIDTIQTDAKGNLQILLAV
jgi:hypothetical protein